VIHASDLSPEVRAKLGISRAPKKRPKQSDEADRAFLFQCQSLKLPPVFVQWRFQNSQHPNNPARKWRTDFVFQDHALMIEIDGGIWIKGAHSHPLDIIRNMRKQNDAELLGYAVLRFTPEEVKSGHAIAFTGRVLQARGWVK
jgi:very-short-patch-repair endonuclease